VILIATALAAAWGLYHALGDEPGPRHRVVPHHLGSESPVLGLDEAHTIMRDHLDCRIDSCPHKHAAYWTLAAAGRIRPDIRLDRFAP
jgi:hypothetical protein